MKLLELEVNQKSYIKILCLCILVVIIIMVSYYASLLSYEKFTLEEDTIIADIGEHEMSVHIDSLTPPGTRNAEMYGWAYKEGETIETINCNYVLKHQETGEMLKLRTRYEGNTNVPKEYYNSGIHTRFLTSGLKSGRYDIYVLYKNNENNILAKTGIYLDI